MALEPKVTYSGQIDESDPAYPYGKAQNETSPGDDDGTPLEEQLVNDLFGFQQALLVEAGLTPSGVPDEVGASQYLDAIRLVAGQSDGAMRGIRSYVDTGHNSNPSSANARLFWCEFDNGAQFWMIALESTAYQTSDGYFFVTTSDLDNTDAWNDAACDGTHVVVVGDNYVKYANSGLGWSDCTGGVTAGSWKAIVHDGTKFVAGNILGQFATSADGVAFSAVINGPTNWLAGTNRAAQIAAGGGRVIAVPETGDFGYFAISDDNGSTWSEVVAPASTAWAGVAYRASDGLWMAIRANGGAYTSTDNGDTWTLGVNPVKIIGHRLWVHNDWFVTMATDGTIIYSKDGVTWYQGVKPMDPQTGLGYSEKSFVKGEGGLGWVMSATSISTYLCLTQADSRERFQYP